MSWQFKRSPEIGFGGSILHGKGLTSPRGPVSWLVLDCSVERRIWVSIPGLTVNACSAVMNPMRMVNVTIAGFSRIGCQEIIRVSGDWRFMATKWTRDRVLSGDREYPCVYLYVNENEGPARTVDLQGAHVLLDVDQDGNVSGIEILGPAVFTDLDNLGVVLGRDAEEIVRGTSETV